MFGRAFGQLKHNRNTAPSWMHSAYQGLVCVLSHVKVHVPARRNHDSEGRTREWTGM